ncbi:MAG: adenylate/guanylate cyclase domain-containing protein, partial [Alphaproteobacteria bacterium]|nr:adenylate/guanylate cyclase domain-containing protein [Alphaproteobacteria bacterium]
LAAAVMGAALAGWGRGPAAKGAAGLALLAGFAAADFVLWGRFLIAPPTVPMALAAALGFTFASTALHWLYRRKRDFLRHAFAHYAPDGVIRELLRHPDRLRLGGERRDVTLLFTDIQGFTAMSEAVEGERLVPVLNAYMDRLTDIILAHGGTIDRMVGDAVIAIFNAPLDVPDHACRAVRAAMAIDDFARAYSAEIQARGIPFKLTRIGVNSGPATVGNFGGSQRFQYTAHGDCVNTAARLETLSKHIGTTVLVGGATRDACPEPTLRRVGGFILMGKHEPVDVYEPVADPERLDAYRPTEKALHDAGPDARTTLDAFLERYPADPVAVFHRQRLERGETGDRVVMGEK